MKIVKEILRQIDAVRLRRHMRARLRRRMKRPCLKGAIEEYRRYSPEYADRLELLLYPPMGQKLIGGSKMLCMNEKDQERAVAVLRQLEGMTIADAQELLQWCGNRLLDQPVLKWGFVDDKGKLCGDPEKHEGGSV